MPCCSTIDDRIEFFCFVLYCFVACPSGRPPGPEMEYCTDRESYSLAAGLALGMVCLGVSHTDRNLQLIDMSHELKLYLFFPTRIHHIGSRFSL